MNRYIKFGFSLAEILIALAIVSVIATMGFSIAKKGIADAYKGYYYTGYAGLDKAIKIAKKEVYDDDYPGKDGLTKSDKYKRFQYQVETLLNLTIKNPGNQVTFVKREAIAPNNVTYIIKSHDINSIQDNNPGIIEYIMQIPHPKTKAVQINHRNVLLKYDPDNTFGYLEPQWPGNQQYTEANGYVNLGIRPDLLAFKLESCEPSSYYVLKECNDDLTNCTMEKRKDLQHIYFEGYYNAKKCVQDSNECRDKDRQYKATLVNPQFAY